MKQAMLDYTLKSPILATGTLTMYKGAKMAGRKERNCQIRMSSSLWNLVGEIATELGYTDARGRHSAIIREMVAAAAAKWTYSPYVCRSADHVVLVTRDGNIFFRHVETLRLNSQREKLPCFVEMKPEKRDYYRKQRDLLHPNVPENKWFQRQWLLNHFATWNGKRNANDLESFQQRPLSSRVDHFGTTYKNADLAVNAIGGRFLTREIIIGLRDYVQWKEPQTPAFDRIDIPIDIPTANLEICVIVDQALFESLEVEAEEIAHLALEFRNRESARFEGKDVAQLPEIGFDEQFGRSSEPEPAEEMRKRIDLLRQRLGTILNTRTTEGQKAADSAGEKAIRSSLKEPENFLFYWLRWPSPHLGIEACVRWEKPIRRTE
ncbi:MAG TPA: hypothetical protein VF756_26050 [Thermoanaerobaculia bacterium]